MRDEEGAEKGTGAKQRAEKDGEDDEEQEEEEEEEEEPESFFALRHSAVTAQTYMRPKVARIPPLTNTTPFPHGCFICSAWISPCLFFSASFIAL